MFGFRKVRPPLTTFQRVDIELLLRRTIDVIGKEFVRQSEIITTLSALRLDPSSPESLLDSARREVQQRMPTIAVPYEVAVVEATELGHLSKYQPSNGAAARISIADTTLDDPLRTVMELAYQHAQHFWQTRPAPTPLDTDPRTTNLLPICCGLGVLASDACLYDDQWSQAGWSGWSISRSGYYNAEEIGYALALFARARDETEPVWATTLRLDSEVTLNAATRYFAKQEREGGRLLFDAARIPTTAGDLCELAAWLRGNDLTFALAAGYALANRQDLSPRVIEAAVQATRSRDKDLVPVATRLLGGARQSDADAESRVRELIASRSPQTSLAALQSASSLGIPLAEFAGRIAKLLDLFAEDSFALVKVIAQQGASLRLLAAQICEHIGHAIGADDDALADALLECLLAIADDPAASIESRIRSPEIRGKALVRLADLRGRGDRCQHGRMSSL